MMMVRFEDEKREEDVEEMCECNLVQPRRVVRRRLHGDWFDRAGGSGEVVHRLDTIGPMRVCELLRNTRLVACVGNGGGMIPGRQIYRRDG